MKPLDGIRVIDFSQFLAGPAASLRLADLGAEVIKIERPGSGDICRQLYVAKQKIADESTIFLAINRNKKSVALDLKNKSDKEALMDLIKSADVVLQNFRPFVAERLGIDYQSLKQVNPNLIYGSVTGYGKYNPEWRDKPGQDLLAQSLSGIVWQNIKESKQPAPMGLSVGDLMAAYDLAQGVLSLLVRRGISGIGGEVEVSLIESLMNIQATALTEYLNPTDAVNTPNIYGVYQTKDSHIAIANIELAIFNLKMKANFKDITEVTHYISTFNSTEILETLSQHEILSEPVLDWKQLRKTDHYKSLGFEQHLDQNGHVFKTTRCPIMIDGQRYYSDLSAPKVGEHNHDYLG